HLPGQAPVPVAGAVRAGRDRTRDRLAVDVAHVLQRQSVRVQDLVEPPQGHAGLDGDQIRPGVDAHHAVHGAHVDHDAFGGGDAAEGVTGSHRFDAQPVIGGVAYRRSDFARPAGSYGPDRFDGFGAGPVLPRRGSHWVSGMSAVYVKVAFI